MGTDQTSLAGRKVLVTLYGHVPFEQVSRQMTESLLAAGCFVRIVCTGAPRDELFPSKALQGAAFQSIYSTAPSRNLGPLGRLLAWISYRRALSRCIRTFEPDLIIAVQFPALAAISPRLWSRVKSKVAFNVFDIPAIEFAGRLDRIILRRALARVSQAKEVWASDTYKGEFVKDSGGLSRSPRICYVARPLSYITEQLWPRDPWLRIQLRARGASIGDSDGCVIVRAGAVGPYGGLEETLEAMRGLPPNILFLMMGRAKNQYKVHLENLISSMGLERRAFIWNLPSDVEWKRAALGADVGHLIHVCNPSTPAHVRRAHELNSALSTVRLFHYMAAGLPIISYDDPRMEDLYREVPCFRVARISSLTSDLHGILLDLTTNPDLRYRFGTIARKAHEDKYNWEAQFRPLMLKLPGLAG